MEFIRGTTLVYLKIRNWSGSIKASRDRDIKLGINGEIPPENLLSLGRKKIFPPDAILPLTRLRASAERICLAKGTRFMGGYAIPNECVAETEQSLKAIEEKFVKELDSFLNNFETNKTAWLTENVQFEHILRNQVPDRDVVKKSFELSFKLFNIDILSGYEPDESEISCQVFHEIGQTCKEMARRMIDRTTAIGGKTLKKQLVEIMTKLELLAFGNSRILKVLGEFRALHDSIPEERIDRDHKSHGQALIFLTMCADSDKLESIINGEFSITHVISNIQNSDTSLVNKDVSESQSSLFFIGGDNHQSDVSFFGAPVESSAGPSYFDVPVENSVEPSSIDVVVDQKIVAGAMDNENPASASWF
ncbi:MAG: hypothetical protein JKY09_07715 [Crocinitomicaceae bacterium]|nr:hypothetical protein [Crocinitomicaceae bacterium]